MSEKAKTIGTASGVMDITGPCEIELELEVAAA